VGLFEAFSCPWPPSPTFYKLLEIERPTLYPTAFRSPQLELIELDDEQRRKCQRRPLRTYSRRRTMFLEQLSLLDLGTSVLLLLALKAM